MKITILILLVCSTGIRPQTTTSTLKPELLASIFDSFKATTTTAAGAVGGAQAQPSTTSQTPAVTGQPTQSNEGQCMCVPQNFCDHNGRMTIDTLVSGWGLTNPSCAFFVNQNLRSNELGCHPSMSGTRCGPPPPPFPSYATDPCHLCRLAVIYHNRNTMKASSLPNFIDKSGIDLVVETGIVGDAETCQKGEVCCLPPKNDSSNLSSGNGAQDEQCKCVPYYYCDDGINLIHITNSSITGWGVTAPRCDRHGTVMEYVRSLRYRRNSSKFIELCRSELFVNDAMRRFNAPRPFLLLPRVPILCHCDVFVTNFTAAEFRSFLSPPQEWMSDVSMRRRRLGSAQRSIPEAVFAYNIFAKTHLSVLPTTEVSSDLRLQEQILVGSEPSSMFQIRTMLQSTRLVKVRYHTLTEYRLKASIVAFHLVSESSDGPLPSITPFFSLNPLSKRYPIPSQEFGGALVRLGETRICPESMEMCCKLPKNVTIIPTPTTTGVEVGGGDVRGCGQSNPNGIDFVIAEGSTWREDTPIRESEYSNAFACKKSRRRMGLGFYEINRIFLKSLLRAQTKCVSAHNETKNYCKKLPVKQGKAGFAEYPWVVALLADNVKYIGVGVLIHPDVVMTAAHVVYDYRQSADKLKIRAGEWDTQTAKERLRHQERTVREVYVHRDFINVILFNDIALLRLVQPVVIAEHVNVLCLPQQNAVFDGVKDCVVNGWGKDVFGETDLLFAGFFFIVHAIFPAKS
ncbi:Phenoloxidase-activating factor 2 [Eumeta japonica]|uniref:Phenoloxidase-activating factor 2 n=1 Tax=Eumeta variegata TaxID=151549 RepID=A0A4C1Y356_EUMVA|nr:Phenoloxidase-activating factor 2 [Eumeta japonica]